MIARNLRNEMYELHRRKHGSTYYASDDTGRAFAYLLAEMCALDRPNPEVLFQRWRRGDQYFRFYSITVLPKARYLRQRNSP